MELGKISENIEKAIEKMAIIEISGVHWKKLGPIAFGYNN